MRYIYLVAAIGIMFASGISTLQAKQSLSGLGFEGLENLKRVAAGYGTKICKDNKIKQKDDIAKKAWGSIRHSCGKFTFGLIKDFEDDASVIYSMCLFSALESCQRMVGITEPCTRVESCRASLGVPKEGE